MIKFCEQCKKEFTTKHKNQKYCSYECSSKSRIKDLTGQKFGRLTVIKHIKHKFWLCKCECGNEIKVISDNFKAGRTKSCGCYRKENSEMLLYKHGKKHSRLYNVWCGIKRRCFNINCQEYKYYGLRGITICEEWKNDFEQFYNWAMLNGYNEYAKFGECTIDRIDVNGNYEPRNCRWITLKEQSKNKRKKEA